MEAATIQQEFLQKTSEEIRILEEGLNRFRIFTPFMLGDGDHIAVVLKKEYGQWILTDEGDTFSHLNLMGLPESAIHGTRRDLINGILEECNSEDRDGEIFTRVNSETYGSSLYSFLQMIIRVSDLIYLSKDRVKSAFLEDFKTLIQEAVPDENRREFNWHNIADDPDSKYKVDCRINHMEKPLVIFALQNDDKIRDSTIAIRQFEKWNMPFLPIGIFNNRENRNQRVVDRFLDACEKTFSNIDDENRGSIIEYLKKETSMKGILRNR
jgi:Domain of unknown function DUF1828